MKKLFSILLVIFVFNAPLRVLSGEKYTLAFYNLENFFDTIPSTKHDDRDFTPQGKFQWDTNKYNTKINNLSQVIDQLNADILAVSEVESEQAVRDLIINLKTDYNYIFIDSGDKRGISQALFYKGDKFTPTTYHRVANGSSRQFLRVEGCLDGISLNIIVCHLASNFNSASFRSKVFTALRTYVNHLINENPESQLIVLGDFNSRASDKIFEQNFGNRVPNKDSLLVFNPFSTLDKQGLGSCAYNDRWLLYDNMLFDNSFRNTNRLKYLSCGIFIKDYMLNPKNSTKSGYPLRSFLSGKYTKGYSDHLPVWSIVERRD